MLHVSRRHACVAEQQLFICYSVPVLMVQVLAVKPKSPGEQPPALSNSFLYNVCSMDKGTYHVRGTAKRTV